MSSELWQRLRTVRGQVKKTQQQIADACGIDRAAVSQWEAADPAKRTRPDWTNLQKFADVTGAPLPWLLDDASDINDDWLARLETGLIVGESVGSVIHVAAGEITPGYLRLPLLDLPAGAGPGVEMEAEPDVVQWIDVAEQWAHKHFDRSITRIRVLTARGDSMVGAGIMSGDLLFVDSGITRYDGDGFYILQFMDGWQVKRLRADVLSQQVEIVSVRATGEDSRAVPSTKLRDLRIGGKVSAWWTLRKH